MPSCLAEYKSTHPRKFGNHVTVHRPTERSTVRPHHRDHCLLSYFLASLGAQEKSMSIAHQCCDQLTAVKTEYPLISITWPYRGLKCWPIEVEYLFEVIRWQITSFKWSQVPRFFFPMIHMNYEDILNSASRILQCWSYYVEINSARHQHDTERTQNRAEL